MRRLKWDIELWPRNPLHRWFMLRCPQGIPKVYWRRTGLIRILFTSVYLVMIGSCLVGGNAPCMVPIVLLALGLFWEVAPRMSLSRLKREMEGADFRLCLNCGYVLRGLPDQHVCPECGEPYESETLRRKWEYWLTNRRLPEPNKPGGAGSARGQVSAGRARLT